MERVNLNYVKSKRIELKLSQTYVANKLGFKNASTYLKYESGAYTFKANMLPKLAKVLDIDIESFFIN